MSTFNPQKARVPIRWPGERRVTICIAAICEQPGAEFPNDSCIVICADWRASSVFGYSDTWLKSYPLSHGLKCLAAGDDIEINATTRLFDKHLDAVQDFHDGSVKSAIDDALAERKFQKVDTYIRGRLAIGYKEFLSTGKERLPPDVFRDVLTKTMRLRVDATFIIAGFVENLPLLIQTERDCQTAIKEGVATIGEGSILAYSSLAFRQLDTVTPLNVALYAVYEAKKSAERSGSVSQKTMLEILYANGESKGVHHQQYDEFNQLLAAYGPKVIPRDVKIDLTKFTVYGKSSQ